MIQPNLLPQARSGSSRSYARRLTKARAIFAHRRCEAPVFRANLATTVWAAGRGTITSLFQRQSMEKRCRTEPDVMASAGVAARYLPKFSLGPACDGEHSSATGQLEHLRWAHWRHGGDGPGRIPRTAWSAFPPPRGADGNRGLRPLACLR